MPPAAKINKEAKEWLENLLRDGMTDAVNELQDTDECVENGLKLLKRPSLKDIVGKMMKWREERKAEGWREAVHRLVSPRVDYDAIREAAGEVT